MNSKKRTVILGLVFLLLLVFAYLENSSFFGSVGDVFSNAPLAVFFIFIHNVLVVSLILLGMSFYVELVLNFMSKNDKDYVALHNPRLFAFVFTVMVILISILRASTLVYGKVLVQTLVLVILLSTPNAIIEGYGIFQTIEKTLKRNMTTKALVGIYLLFLIAAIIEVGYVYLLRAITCNLLGFFWFNLLSNYHSCCEEDIGQHPELVCKELVHLSNVLEVNFYDNVIFSNDKVCFHNLVEFGDLF